MADVDPAITAARDQAKRFRDATDRLRERATDTAKTLGGLGTAGLTAIGIAKLTDVFPWPPGEWIALGATIAGFLAMAFVLTAFTYRTWTANRPLVAKVNAREMDADDDERAQAEKVYATTYRLNGLESLGAYVARAYRFQRIADHAADATAAQALRERADLIRAEVEDALARGAHVVVRGRVTRALGDRTAAGLALLFVAGLLAFGFGTDRIASERTDQVTTLKACVDAVVAGVSTDKLPPICSDVSPKSGDPTTEQTDAAGISSLSAEFQSCIDTAETLPARPVSMCDGIKAQIAAAAK
jgi:hypothetical protein